MIPNCFKCGKFISYKDVENKIAVRKLITPDSEYSLEVYQTLCKRCNSKIKLENLKKKFIKVDYVTTSI